MYTAFGLSRDPFAPLCDGSLYWETPAREAVRRSAEDLLRSGTSIWLSGPPGSGRSAILARVADDLAHEGQRVLWTESAGSRSPEEFLLNLLEVASDASPPGGLLEAAEALYVPVLEGFYESGTVVCFPGLDEPTVGCLAEASILSRFRVAGRPILALALVGEGDPPFVGLERVSVPAPSPDDLEACLLHRATVCGNSDLLFGEALAAVASASKGFGEAMEKARQAVARETFRSTTPHPVLQSAVTTGGRADAVEGRATLLDPTELDDLSGLLESLSPGR